MFSIAAAAGPICGCIVIIILFFILGNNHLNSSLCRQEDTCVKENILGGWEPDPDATVLGERNESGCYIDVNGLAHCVCKQQYGGEKCEIEVCTEAERTKCNAGIAVPVANIGEETNGTCIVSTPNGTESECVCNPAYKGGGGDVDCNVEKSLAIPEMDPDKLTDAEYDGVIFTGSTCDAINCTSADSNLTNSAINLSNAAVSGRLAGQYIKKHGTGHILPDAVYRTEREMNVMKAFIQTNCQGASSDPSSSNELIESGADIGISELTTGEMAELNAHYPAGTLLKQAICNLHNRPSDQIVHGPSYYKVYAQDGRPDTQFTEVPMGECVFDDDAISRDVSGMGPHMKALLGQIKYMFLQFGDDPAEGYNDAYGRARAEARRQDASIQPEHQLIFGPLSPVEIRENKPTNISWRDLSNQINIRGFPVSDTSIQITGGITLQSARIKPLPEELYMELCSGCWVLSEESLEHMAADEEAIAAGNTPIWGQHWSSPIIFTRNPGGCSIYSGDHYSKWVPIFDGEGYCNNNVCTHAECCTAVAGAVDRCNTINELPRYNYCSALDPDMITTAANALNAGVDATTAWVAGGGLAGMMFGDMFGGGD